MIFVFLALVLSERSFKVVGDEFQLDGKPFRYFSGSFHYFRQHPNSWEDTFKKIANGGLNAIQTYVAWNLHEPRKGVYNFEGMADIERFLDLAAKYNILVIIRPGPYICSEWDFGALPYWLLREKNIVVRTKDPIYMKHVTDWFTVLFKKLRPHMYHNGGNIIMVQLENEYGSYPACDKVYLTQLSDLTQNILGNQTQLYTTDGNNFGMLNCGSLIQRAYATVDFDLGDPTSSFKLERDFNGGHGPYVNSEYYTGKLDHWGEKHNKKKAEDVAKWFDAQLAMGGNVNMYMYFGGTNFAFFNGANGGKTSYAADPTSYDHDAPLSEAGDMTYKYEKILEVIKKYRSDIPVYDVKNTTKKDYGYVSFTQEISFYDALNTIGVVHVPKSEKVLTMEEIDVDYGFVFYRTKIEKGGLMSIPHVHDRGYVFVDKERQCILQHAAEKDYTIPAGELDILVENMGRLNYGGDFFEMKGITDGVKLDGKDVLNWEIYGFNLSNVEELTFKQISTGKERVPYFYKGYFEVEEIADTFLNPTGWTKGIVFINGVNIGRYWIIGPQLTLYVPMHILKVGTNEIIVFEFEGSIPTPPTMKFDSFPNIDTIK